jgi:hypothetical protein
VSLTWHPNGFTILLAEDKRTIGVDGLTDNLGLFGMHFADRRAIHLTHLATGCRVHPEPGFPDLASAAWFAELIIHLDWTHASRFSKEDKVFIHSTYNDVLARIT